MILLLQRIHGARMSEGANNAHMMHPSSIAGTSKVASTPGEGHANMWGAKAQGGEPTNQTGDNDKPQPRAVDFGSKLSQTVPRM